LQRTYSFTSPSQAQYFVQTVGRFCSEKDHHPEWHVLDSGRTVSIKLSSHFAGNKVTLFDFQLAEHMNKQYKVTQKWFSEYPLVSSSSWTSFKIFLVSFVLINFVFQMGTHWGNMYPSSAQRGEKPQSAHYRPLLVNEFEFFAGGIRSEREVELYAKAFVEDYAFKRALFNHKSMF
jgi:pterin-4a-carbinolamine dehydratase